MLQDASHLLNCQAWQMPTANLHVVDLSLLVHDGIAESAPHVARSVLLYFAHDSIVMEVLFLVSTMVTTIIKATANKILRGMMSFRNRETLDDGAAGVSIFRN